MSGPEDSRMTDHGIEHMALSRRRALALGGGAMAALTVFCLLPGVARATPKDARAKLAERGFITFAPHNLYRGEDRYRWLDRKANAIGCSLFSFIVAQHDQMLRWLETLPYVDSQRIAFYGLSYGGETAVRVPPKVAAQCPNAALVERLER